MLDGRAVRERQLIQMKRADGVHKSACHLSELAGQALCRSLVSVRLQAGAPMFREGLVRS